MNGDKLLLGPADNTPCKRGLDFEEAQALWADSALVEIPARVSDEPRWALIGKIDQIISVRRSRDEEVAIYESQDI